MSNALDDLVSDVDRLVSEMGSNLPSDETSRSWYAAISAQFLAFNRRLREAIKEERTTTSNTGTSRRGRDGMFDIFGGAMDNLAEIREVLKDELKEEALKLQALELVERVAETPDEKLKDFELDIKRKLLRLAHKKRKSGCSCPSCQALFGEGDASPRCTKPCGVCVSDGDGKEISDKEETLQVEKVKKPLAHVVGDMVVNAISEGIRRYLSHSWISRTNRLEIKHAIEHIRQEWEHKKMEDGK